MPGPTTEVLNEDLKAIRDDLHKVEVSIRGEIGRLDVSLTEIKTTLKDAIRVATWGITLIAGTLIASAVSGVWWASNINTRVDGIEKRFDKLEASIAKVLEQTKPAAKP